MKYFLITLLLWPVVAHSQELFTYTEPASNMAAKGIGVRINNRLAKEKNENVYQLNPEVMWGVSRKVMVHMDVYFDNSTSPLSDKKQFNYKGAGLYGKYRFYSQDEVHNHFRMAVFGRVAANKGYNYQRWIDFIGKNSGFESGIVATKLAGKVALSSTISYLHTNDKIVYYKNTGDAIGASFSIGKLMLPKEYTSYEQINMNLMLEILSQYNIGGTSWNLDISPSIQFIFFSRMRIDLGYQGTIKGFLLRFEYNFFNVY